jgi:hypothetical protein
MIASPIARMCANVLAEFSGRKVAIAIARIGQEKLAVAAIEIVSNRGQRARELLSQENKSESPRLHNLCNRPFDADLRASELLSHARDVSSVEIITVGSFALTLVHEESVNPRL